MVRNRRFVPPAPRGMSREEFEQWLTEIPEAQRSVVDDDYNHPPQTVHPEDTIDAIAASGNPPPRYGDINPPNSAIVDANYNNLRRPFVIPEEHERMNEEARVVANQVLGAYSGLAVRHNPSYHYVLHETGNACNLGDTPYNPWHISANPCNEIQPKSEEDINMSEQRQWLPEDFPFAGTTVALNPEQMSDARAYEREYGDKLIVIDHRADESTLDTILTMGDQHMPGWTVQCMFLRSGKRTSFRAKQLMIIDEPIVPITMMQLSNGNSYYLNKELMPDAQAIVDKQVITKGSRIDYKHDWDVHFRNAKVAKAYEALNEQAQREEERKSKKKKHSTAPREMFVEVEDEGDDSEF